MSTNASAERVAALYDIHGNLPALDAALRDVERLGASLVIIGGDVVLGPMPTHVLERLAALATPVQFLRGNCDRLVVEAARHALPATLPSAVRDMIEWTAAQLSSEQLAFLAQLPTSLCVEIVGRGAVRFCHATPRNDEELITPATGDEQLREMLSGSEEAWIVCGHTHVQFERKVAPWTLVNAGSVGMSTGPAEAHWLLLDRATSWQQARYDAKRASNDIGGTSFPGAREFIDGYVMSAPSAATVWSRLTPNGARGERPASES